MYNGQVKGMFAFGMNGVAIGPNSQKEHRGAQESRLAGRRARSIPTRRASSGRRPGITTEEMKKINTTVYRLPCAGFAEKDGTFVNSARWLQWKNAALPPPGEAKVDQEILARIFLKVRELYQKEGGKFPDPILNLAWPYTNPLNPSLAEVAQGDQRQGARPTSRIRSSPGRRSRPASSCRASPGCETMAPPRAATGSTAGSWTEAGAQMQRRGTEDPSGLGIYPNWAWSWPANRRVHVQPRLVRSVRQALGSERRQVWWSEDSRKWVGNDVPDFKADSNPKDHMGPFIMNPEGVGRLFAPLAAFADGPFPEHYEPIESPIANPLHPQQSNNPVVKKFKTEHRQVLARPKRASTSSARPTG